MRLPVIPRRLLLTFLALGLIGLLIQACQDYTPMGGNMIDWPPGGGPVAVNPANCRTDNCRRTAFENALPSKATGWDTTFSSYTEQTCYKIDKGENPKACGPGSPPLSPNSIHVAQHIYFADDATYKQFRAAMGLSVSDK